MVYQWSDVQVTNQTSPTSYAIQNANGQEAPFSFHFLSPGGAAPIRAGNVYDTDHGLTVTFSSQHPGNCGFTSIEVDQAVYDQSGTLTSLGLQFDVQCPDGAEQLGTIAYNLVPSTAHQGYYIYGDDGSLGGGFGNDSYLDYLGDLSTVSLNQPIVGMAQTPSGAGYWMVASDGGSSLTAMPTSTVRPASESSERTHCWHGRDT